MVWLSIPKRNRASCLIIYIAYGAEIAIGDWNEEEGLALKKQLGDRIRFRKCDVSKWDDLLALFHDTWTAFGVIHTVISNAGISFPDTSLTEDEYNDAGVLLPPDLRSIDVNLNAHIYIIKCALHYFKKWPTVQCQIVLTASAGSFFPAPPVYTYCAAKAGVVALMRGFRSEVVKKNATINIVAPWLTSTQLTGLVVLF